MTRISKNVAITYIFYNTQFIRYMCLLKLEEHLSDFKKKRFS